MVMNGFDTDGDGENNFYTVNGRAFYYAQVPDPRAAARETVRIYLANLTEFDLINSFHLHGEFFRYYPTGTHRPVRVHRHGDALPGPARDHRDRLRTTPAASCSTPTSPSSPSSAGWASSRSWTMSGDGRAPSGGRGAGACWALVPILLLVGVVARVRRDRRLARSTWSGAEPAAGRRVRRAPRRVPRRARSASACATRSPRTSRSRRSRSTTRSSPSRVDGPATLGRLRSSTIVDPLRLGRGRPAHRRRHELDGHPDDRTRSRRRSRRPAPSAAASSATRSSACCRRGPVGARACSGCPRCAAPTRAGWPPSWR